MPISVLRQFCRASIVVNGNAERTSGGHYVVERLAICLLQISATGIASITLRFLLPEVGDEHEAIKIELAHNSELSLNSVRRASCWSTARRALDEWKSDW